MQFPSKKVRDWSVSNYKVAQAFLPAGFGDFPVATFMRMKRGTGKSRRPADKNVCATSKMKPLWHFVSDTKCNWEAPAKIISLAIGTPGTASARWENPSPRAETVLGVPVLFSFQFRIIATAERPWKSSTR
jgi:hypothetical protein